MLNENRIALAKYRLDMAKEKYDVAILLFNEGRFRDAANRAYYAIFNCLRAVFALEAIDFKKHSGAISYFRQSYIKTGIFNIEYSELIGSAFLIRNQSDYEDFFVISKEDTKNQCENAFKFYCAVSEYVQSIVGEWQ